ncbi:hypothetical protein [Caldisericum exile]|jgi:hypothetical protein|uniref:hypothetical protein n=2 Tax=Caldisericum TaxID=693074 RepID=UPI003C709AA6
MRRWKTLKESVHLSVMMNDIIALDSSLKGLSVSVKNLNNSISKLNEKLDDFIMDSISSINKSNELLISLLKKDLTNKNEMEDSDGKKNGN